MGDYRKLLYKYNIHHDLLGFRLNRIPLPANYAYYPQMQRILSTFSKWNSVMSAIEPGMILLAYLLRLNLQRHSGSAASRGYLTLAAVVRGTPGATNVLRIGGKGAAVAVLIFRRPERDAPPSGVAYALGLSPFWLGLVAIAACLGHIWADIFPFPWRERCGHRIWRHCTYRSGFNGRLWPAPGC
ncbi:G3P acyltransferase [Kluyvera cryocrescens]|uniref:G3P acyltransferase n=1 Tax=Kluyvera cryocrescens TaxID=580 RepID=A0A485AJD5_KLUCR|nr:G3P acyltransferase [Kluyvera cryocrescens]